MIVSDHPTTVAMMIGRIAMMTVMGDVGIGEAAATLVTVGVMVRGRAGTMELSSRATTATTGAGPGHLTTGVTATPHATDPEVRRPPHSRGRWCFLYPEWAWRIILGCCQ